MTPENSPPTSATQLAEIGLHCARNEAGAMFALAGAAIDPDQVIDVIGHFVNEAVPTAVTEAQQAWDQGAGFLAEVLFMGQMKLAGIRAAKYVLGVE
jgi:hypothetical protein